MSAWQRAGYVPGLFGSVQPPPQPAAAPPPSAPQRSAIVRVQQSAPAGSFGAGGAVALSGNHLEAEFSALPLFGRSLLYAIGMALIVTAPWAAASFYRWIVARIRVPGRPNLAFEGKAGDIWWAFVLVPLSTFVPFVGIFISMFFSLLTIRWAVKNISSDGRLLPLTFTGSYWAYLGWQILLGLSFITIIGWAWVITAAMRWVCRNIQGTTRTISFMGSGLQVLWRTWVFLIVSSFIIPIPWMMRWYYRWFVSQIAVG